MQLVHRAVVTGRRRLVAPVLGRWMALEDDYKSIACAVAVLGAVVGLEIRIPW